MNGFTWMSSPHLTFRRFPRVLLYPMIHRSCGPLLRHLLSANLDPATRRPLRSPVPRFPHHGRRARIRLMALRRLCETMSTIRLKSPSGEHTYYGEGPNAT